MDINKLLQTALEETTRVLSSVKLLFSIKRSCAQINERHLDWRNSSSDSQTTIRNMCILLLFCTITAYFSWNKPTNHEIQHPAGSVSLYRLERVDKQSLHTHLSSSTLNSNHLYIQSLDHFLFTDFAYKGKAQESLFYCSKADMQCVVWKKNNSVKGLCEGGSQRYTLSATKQTPFTFVMKSNS